MILTNFIVTVATFLRIPCIYIYILVERPCFDQSHVQRGSQKLSYTDNKGIYVSSSSFFSYSFLEKCFL